MLKAQSIVVILLLAFFLSGCQANNVTPFTDATSIEVYDWNNEELIATIEDQDFIKDLEEALDQAETYGTDAIDWAGPDYRLVFKNENKVLHEIGYCKELQNFGGGVEGRYWESEKLYEVEIELPIE